ADVGQGAVAAQLLGDGDGVDGVAGAVELQHRAEYRPMGRTVEVVPAHELQDLGDGVLGEQHGAEDRLLGLDVVGWDALVGWGSAGPRAALGDGADGHCRSPCSLAPLAGYDLHVHGGLDLGVEPDGEAVGADGLDGGVQVDAAPVDGGAADALDPPGGLAVPDAPEQG